MKHKIGDKVIALNDPEDENCQPRKKGNIYTVQDIKYCVKCGVQSVNVIGQCSFIFDEDECVCGYVEKADNLWWTVSKHFAPINPTTLQQFIEQEEYELAAIIKDLLTEKEFH